MKTMLGLACLVAAVLLTPAAWDVLVNGGTGTLRHVGPAAIAWVAGIWLLANRPRDT